MTAEKHYAEAERVREALRSPLAATEQGFDGWQRDDLIALATLHAHLAIAAGQQALNETLGAITDVLDVGTISVRVAA